MSRIRIFTSGTHNGLTFTNEDIDMIASKTSEQGEESIPFVLGHPKKNLPIMGFINKAKLTKYVEGGKTSIGFDKEDADMSEESMEALRELGNNRLSVRLTGGVIKHIGLVPKAAVTENNTQDFAEHTGCFAATDELFSPSVWDHLKNILKPKNMETEKEEPKDFTTLTAAVENNTKQVTCLIQALKAKEATEAATVDFSSADFSHLTDEQRKECIDFCSKLDTEARNRHIAFVKSMNKKPPTPQNGSVTTDFGTPPSKEESIESLVSKQVAILK